jgi:hypothetical protein
MNGRLGSLFVGDTCVGGILDWSLDLTLLDHVRDTATVYKLQKWKVTALGYWVYETPKIVMIKLYADYGQEYWEGKAECVSSTRKLWDTLIHEPIEFVGEKPLEGHQ